MSEQKAPPLPPKAHSVEEALPPVTLIVDESTRERTIRCIRNHAPDYFWTAPAASSYEHHNPFCCGQRGLWIHTLMVATAYERLVDSHLEQSLITEKEADYGRSAVILHDLKKYGASYEDSESAASDHDLQAAELIRTETPLDASIADAVAAHMGPWYDGPEPSTPLEQLVHQADMVASTKNGTFGVLSKPAAISDLYPGLPEAKL
jgi:hypothetical protein